MSGVTLLASVRCAIRKPWVIFASLAVLSFAAWSVWSTTEVVSARDGRRAEAQNARAYICEKVNELPDKLGRLLSLAERRRQILGPTTTVVRPPDLTAEEAAELSRLDAEIARLTADLGRPIDCSIAATGTTIGRRP